jgi:short subunit dehydrogenase-like uncharacterized protein
MIMIYGATGFTGRLVVEAALARGMRPVLAGRSTAVEDLARAFGLSARRFGLDAPELRGVGVLLNAAGPFEVTAPPWVRACLAAGVHYLDLAGEYPEHQALAAQDADARAAGVMLLPGAGFGVVPTDVAAGLAARGVGRVRRLVLAYETRGAPSRGTLDTVLPRLHRPGVEWRDGAYRSIRGGARRLRLRDGRRGVALVTNPWRADQVSARLSIEPGSIETYSNFPAAARLLMRIGGGPLGALLRRVALSSAPAGPSAEDRAKGGSTVWAIAEGTAGRRQVILRGPDPYDFTASVAALCADLAQTHAVSGVQSPTRAFGPDLLSNLAGVTLDIGALEAPKGATS